MELKTIFRIILLVFLLFSKENDACEVEDLRIEAGTKCNNTGSLVLLNGQPCLITKTIDVPVDTVIDYNELFCMGNCLYFNIVVFQNPDSACKLSFQLNFYYQT